MLPSAWHTAMQPCPPTPPLPSPSPLPPPQVLVTLSPARPGSIIVDSSIQFLTADLAAGTAAAGDFAAALAANPNAVLPADTYGAVEVSGVSVGTATAAVDPGLLETGGRVLGGWRAG